MDRRSPLAAVVVGLIIIAIGCGAPPAEPPVERHESTAERHEPRIAGRVAESRAARPHPRAAATMQYSDAPTEYPALASPGSDHAESHGAGSAPVEIRGDRTTVPPIHPSSPPVLEQTADAALPAGSSSPTKSAPISAAILRAYFARRFLYETWYLLVRDIDVHGRFASIVAWHLNESDALRQARHICDAALSLQRLRGASVRFGSRSVNCSSKSGS